MVVSVLLYSALCHWSIPTWSLQHSVIVDHNAVYLWLIMYGVNLNSLNGFDSLQKVTKLTTKENNGMPTVKSVIMSNYIVWKISCKKTSESIVTYTDIWCRLYRMVMALKYTKFKLPAYCLNLKLRTWGMAFTEWSYIIKLMYNATATAGLYKSEIDQHKT